MNNSGSGIQIHNDMEGLIGYIIKGPIWDRGAEKYIIRLRDDEQISALPKNFEDALRKKNLTSEPFDRRSLRLLKVRCQFIVCLRSHKWNSFLC